MSKVVKERQPENRWTPEEDEVLVAAIENCGPIIVWSQVSACLPGRNNKSCRKRWIHSLDPTLRKGRWTEEEDSVLVNAVETYGTHWFQVAKLLPGRTDDQCAKRWRENLDPAISRKPWTKEEDEILMNTFETLGKRWKDIASRFQGRPPVHCRNRVQSLVRARRRAAKVRGVAKGASKTKTVKSYDALGDMPSSGSGADVAASWADLERHTPISFDGTEAFDAESVSSHGSGEPSLYPLTPSRDSPENVVRIPTLESSRYHASGMNSAQGVYNFHSDNFYNGSPSTSSTSSTLDWNPIPLEPNSLSSASLTSTAPSSWEKQINSASSNFDISVGEWFGGCYPSNAQSASHLPSVLPSIGPHPTHHYSDSRSFRHHPYLSHSSSYSQVRQDYSDRGYSAVGRPSPTYNLPPPSLMPTSLGRRENGHFDSSTFSNILF